MPGILFLLLTLSTVIFGFRYLYTRYIDPPDRITIFTHPKETEAYMLEQVSKYTEEELEKMYDQYYLTNEQRVEGWKQYCVHFSSPEPSPLAPKRHSGTKERLVAN